MYYFSEPQTKSSRFT